MTRIPCVTRILNRISIPSLTRISIGTWTPISNRIPTLNRTLTGVSFPIFVTPPKLIKESISLLLLFFFF
jgi:hypothetical protein